ncbi:hypothetical protein H257_03000 [Aphanomyces astaci]|uniref:Maspardin n=1 Tax=Aphanomyces astaci TaxID=112090 RepID=W4GZK5_APHAT|nr:hypothetical protein H257_03000 [Aphanomyces astaci]ETV85160.1 hypothetical protein H257_03000 [Aphanomyces astaci]|eukprot:XP_009825178.1 hypothetical protein H257_03000 [Aphanomyces astaci]
MAHLKTSEVAFLSTVAKQRLTTYDGNLWEFYDVGDRKLTPLVCLPGTVGGPLIFHRVIAALQEAGGYRVIALQHPVVWTHQEWVHSFDRFLDALNLPSVHIYGVCLGAFLAQRYSSVYPRRVLSLAFTNGFCNTKVFGANSPCVKMLPMLPTFYLKKYVVGNFSHDGTSDAVRATMAYMRAQLDALSQPQLASRLTLVSLSSDHLSWGISIPHTRVTLIDSYGSNNEFTTELREQMYERYPDAKKALMKTAGDFPYLSHDDEVILQLRVHLRSNGHEANA